ncbi:AEC family transporter [Bosea sp. 117]|uniref:AEC family transporter n=1 Tax=Bosea sp. 117 TaxID=1125973 RepID=UPI000493E9C6|nr:AEC family transporter [Bosea sp. 117]
MSSVLAALLPVFLVVALGVALKRGLLPEASHWLALERLTYFVLFPALIVVSIGRAELGGVAVIGVCIALLGGLAIMALLLSATRVPASRILGLDGPGYTSLYQGALRWNTYVGLAIAGGLEGAAGLAVAAVAIAVIIPVANILSVVTLARYGGNATPGLRAILMQIARNPFIWSCLLGIVINLFHIPVPPVLVTFGDILGRASLALGLLVVGAGLHIAGLRNPRAATWVSCVLKLAVMPALCIGIGIACGLKGVDLVVVAIAAAVPSAPNGYVLARQMGGDAQLLAEMLTVQILCAVVTLPLTISAVSYFRI